MELTTDKNIRIMDSIFDPNSREQNEVHYYIGPDGSTNYKVWIFLEGRGTYDVDYIIYKLHSTFSDPIRKVSRTLSNPNCGLVIWTWGTFDLGIEIVFKTGEKISASHQMSFDR
jgi:hypothetical protein